MLSKNGELIMKNQGIAFNDYLESIVENSNLFQWNEHNGEIYSKNVENSNSKTLRTIPVVNYQKSLQKPHHFHFQACNN